MKRNVLSGIFIGVCLAVCLTLSVGMALSRSDAQLPSLKQEDGRFNTQYLSQLAAWVEENFFLRQELLLMDSRISVHVLKTSPVSSASQSGGSAGDYGEVGGTGVLLGKNGWLFYGPTVTDFTGIAPMTDRQLHAAAGNLLLMEQYVEEKGGKFVFALAPNKNSLYGQFMPSYGVKAESTNAQRLHKLLEDMGVSYADLFAALGSQQEILYFAHDSHWNSKGAALGADTINQALGVESSFYSGDFSQSQPHTGDLYAMVFPGAADPETDPVYGGSLAFAFQGRVTRPDAIVLNTEQGGGTGHLTAYRDSFGNLLFPYLAASFDTARFSRSTSYDLTEAGEYVLIELVERNLSYLITNVPVMESPVRQLTLPEAISGTAQAQVSADAKVPQGCKQLTGTLPGAPDTDSRVYVVCGGTAYEAFCLDQDGFAVNLPEQAQPDSLVYTVGGKLLMYELK